MITVTKTKSLSNFFEPDSLSKYFYKQELLKIANSGEPKPGVKTKLARAFYRYTEINSASYDKNFTNQIRKIRPDWFISQKEIADQKKQEIIKMAKSGEERPKQKTRLGSALSCYTNKTSGTYDSKFAKLIKSLRPDWFRKMSTAGNNKEILIKLAKSSKKKPSQTTKIGRCLFRYTKKNNKEYDKSFDVIIKKLRPDWFEDKIAQKEQEIIKLAKSGEDRPNKKTKLGEFLGNRKKTKKGRELILVLKKLRPDWFKDKTFQKKQEIIKLAKSGEEKPKYASILGNAFFAYTYEKGRSYDRSFVKIIKKLQPDWLT